jgi:hypothetical protein
MKTLARALLLVATFTLASACDRQNPAPPDGGPPPDSGPRADAHVEIDAGDGDGGSERDAGIPDGGCVSTGACWTCPPLVSEHFLNACSDSTCEPFPNTTARLPRLRADGTVPPLP